MSQRLGLTLFLSVGVSFLNAQAVLAHEGEHGRGARLSPPDGAAAPDARGITVLTADSLIVKVEGLPAGDYSVLLDDGTGTQQPIGKITVAAGQDDDGDDDQTEAGDDHAGAGGDHSDGHHEESEGSLTLTGDALPFGAKSPADLAGRAISVTGADGAVVLAGKTPSPIVEEPQEESGRCPLSRPDPAVDADAEGVLKLESGGGRIVIKVHLSNLDPGKVYEIAITNVAGDATESLGHVTINDGGNGHFKLDSAKGDAIPFGAADLAALVGDTVSVKDDAGAGAVVLSGKVCPAAPESGDDDGDHNPPPPPAKPRCFTAALDGAQETPAVDTKATGKAEIELNKEDPPTLHFEVELADLSGPATAVEIHSGAAGATGDLVVALDPAVSEGHVTLTADQAAAIQTGDTYINVATAANPTGEIRGQLTACAHDGDDGDDEHEDGDHHHGDSGEGGGGAVPAVADPMFVMIGEFDTPFLRGDANQDNSVDLSDAVTVLNFLFASGTRPYCLDAADTNDDGKVDISDPVHILNYLFLAGDPPASPGVSIPGSDQTPDALYCQEAGA